MKHNLQSNKLHLNKLKDIYKNKTKQITKPYCLAEKVRGTAIYLKRKGNSNQLLKSVKSIMYEIKQNK